ncbi:MAG: methionine--tRNA ligase, partial [Oscillospiraceae bacterium]|nr:methionine--tRNA ligase [Oscillospiraceae bacterium]
DYHVRAIQRVFRKMYDKGDIYKGTYKGKYCKPCESFWTESQLKDGMCPDCGRPVEDAEEEAYFFRLSKYADRLLALFEENTDFVQPPERRNEMINNFIKPGLKDFCISRSSVKWGVPVDFDPENVVYVWVDALINYISALGYSVDRTGPLYDKYWPADVHIIGKDIIRFHTIYWPALLMALDVPLPKKVFGHGWLLIGGEKMSKSKHNAVYADQLIDWFGADAVRYYCLSEMPFAADGVLTYEMLAEKYNSDLANILGNLVNRTVAMTKKYFGGTVPAPGEYVGPDRELIAACSAAAADFAAAMDSYHVADASAAVLALLRRANKYIDETAPWVLAKSEEGRARLATVLYALLESIRFAAVLFTPFMPETCGKIFAELGTEAGDYASLAAFGGLVPGGTVGEPVPLFARLDTEAVLKGIEEENARALQPEVPEFQPEITIDDFAGIDLRAAKVLACEPVRKSDKLLRLELDVGREKRQVVSGIAKWYKPEDLTGKTVVLVANLKPARLRGVESQGMILAADNAENDVRVVFLPDDVRPGSRLR